MDHFDAIDVDGITGAPTEESVTQYIIGDEAVATGTFTGGGAAFTSTGAEVEQLSGNVGFGLTYETDMWSAGANYDLDAKSDYSSHSAKLELRVKF